MYLTPYVGASIGNVVLFEGDYEAHLAPNLAKIVMYGSISENYIVNYIKKPIRLFRINKIYEINSTTKYFNGCIA